MLSFPVDIKTTLARDCVDRKQQNEDYIQEYYGKKDDSRAVYAEIRAYRHRECCRCEIDKYHQENCMAKVMHPFLRETCKSTLLAQIVYNGHGSRDGLFVHEDDNPVKLDDIIHDVSKCFSRIPADVPPYQIDIVFPQCDGHSYTDANLTESDDRTVRAIHPKQERHGQPSSNRKNKTVTITHLFKVEPNQNEEEMNEKKNVTWSLVFPPEQEEASYHSQLRAYAKKRKLLAAKVAKENPSPILRSSGSDETVHEAEEAAPPQSLHSRASGETVHEADEAAGGNEADDVAEPLVDK